MRNAKRADSGDRLVKTITIRCSDAAALALMARVEGVSQATAVRTAVIERFDQRRVQPDFIQRTHELHAEDARLLERSHAEDAERTDSSMTPKETR